MQNTLLSALGDAGYRRTAPRQAVTALIARRDGYFTASELISDAQRSQPTIGRATIFRMLDTLEGLGALERLDLPTGGHAYVACEPTHHHHCICSNCGASIEVEDRGLQRVLADIADRTGFIVEDHRLEVYGRCANCRQVPS